MWFKKKQEVNMSENNEVLKIVNDYEVVEKDVEIEIPRVKFEVVLQDSTILEYEIEGTINDHIKYMIENDIYYHGYFIDNEKSYKKGINENPICYTVEPMKNLINRQIENFSRADIFDDPKDENLFHIQKIKQIRIVSKEMIKKTVKLNEIKKVKKLKETLNDKTVKNYLLTEEK